jgi:hypothetical protein
MIGYQVASAGDVDGDGHADVLVTSANRDEVWDFRGEGYFFLGPLCGTAAPGDRDAAFRGDVGYFGAAMVPAVDVTGDGRNDVVLGSPSTDAGTGAIFIVPGLAP